MKRALHQTQLRDTVRVADAATSLSPKCSVKSV